MALDRHVRLINYEYAICCITIYILHWFCRIHELPRSKR